MSRGRLFKRCVTGVAMGALLYSQSMACCWNMHRPVAVSAVVENSKMPADHACCQKKPIPVDGIHWSMPGMDCGSKAFETAALPHSWVDFLTVPYSLESPSFPGNSGFMIAGLDEGVFDTGPPRFLAFRRLLI